VEREHQSLVPICKRQAGLLSRWLPAQGDSAKERNGDWIGHGFHGELEFGFCGKRAELILFFDVFRGSN